MKKTITTLNMNLKDRFQQKAKSIKLFAIIAIAGTTIANAQVPVSNNHEEVESSKSLVSPIQRNPGTIGTPIRNVTINPITATITGLNMVDMGPHKVLVDWSNLATFDSIFFRFTVSGSGLYRIVTIGGNPNPGRYFIDGLLSQTTYDIEVATKMGASTSSWSSPLTVTTLVEPGPRYGNPNPEGDETASQIIKALTASPNPANDATVLKFHSTVDNLLCNITIASATGRRVYKNDFYAGFGANDQAVDVSEWVPGVYMVKLSTNGFTGTIKLIVH